jgi:hypothetical protein
MGKRTYADTQAKLEDAFRALATLGGVARSTGAGIEAVRRRLEPLEAAFGFVAERATREAQP